MLFFDMNGSGLRDEASFVYDAARLNDERQPLQADLLAAINAYLTEHPDIKDGDLVTLEEPGLSGYTVCAGSNCVTTDEKGRFQLVEPEVSRSVSVTIQDPNAGTPALEMRHINKWKRAVTVAEYTKDVDAATMVQLKVVPDCTTDAAALVCKQDEETLLVREQHLNDTTILELGDGVDLMPGNPNDVGLMQGFLTLPYVENFDSYILGYFDVDGEIAWDSNNKQMNYRGETNKWSNPFNFPPITGTWDFHGGVDFLLVDGTPVIAACDGVVEKINNDNGTNIFILHQSDGDSYITMYGHLDSNVLINDGQTVARGEIIALSGHSGEGNVYAGKQIPHLHFGLIDGNYASADKAFDPFRNISGLSSPLTSSHSSWTIDNLLLYP